MLYAVKLEREKVTEDAQVHNSGNYVVVRWYMNWYENASLVCLYKQKPRDGEQEGKVCQDSTSAKSNLQYMKDAR